MNLFAFLSAHWATVLLLWWLLSAVIDGMPAPAPPDGRSYRWAYVSCHLFAANLFRLLRTRFPGDPLAPVSLEDLGVASAGLQPSQPVSVPRAVDDAGRVQ